MTIFLKIETPVHSSIGHYFGEDDDNEIAAFVLRSCGTLYRWTRITEREAASIRAGRPKPEAPDVVSTDATAAIDLGPVIDELARLHARCDAQDAATAEIIKVLDEAVVERLVGIEEKR